jgi:hypothetical protein
MQPESLRRSARLLVLALASCVALGTLAAVDSQPVTVLAIDSGLRLTVEATLGGLPVPVAVQLEHIALLGEAQFARQLLGELCPVGSRVVLRVPGPVLTVDGCGVVHALVVRGFAQVPDPAQARSGPFAEGPLPCIIQVALARAGWAVATPQAGTLPPELGEQLLQAQREARARRLGSHSLPGGQPSAVQSLREPARDDPVVIPAHEPPAERNPNF